MEVIFETPRVILRQFALTDAALILHLNNQPDVLKYLHEPPLNSIADAEKVLKDIIFPQYILYKLGRWAMINRNSHEFMGWCGLKLRPELDGEIDLGYRLLPEYWGRGFATETAVACVAYGFNQKKLAEITARAHIENGASLKVLQKIGLQYIKDEIVDDCPVKTYRIGQQQYLLLTAKNSV
jgi:[ribosomal protein S5]-alanine N-acetyltransferase